MESDFHPGFAGQIGFARVDITPPVGIYARNWGAAKYDCAESIHRPLNLTAMVLANPKTAERLVFIEGDLSWWRNLETWKSFQARLLEATGLSAESLIFSLTHSHASPPLMDTDTNLPGGELLGPWLQSIQDGAIQLVKEATSGCQASVLEWHRGSCQLAHNRNLIDPLAESSRRIIGFNPKNTADSTLLVGRVTDSKGTVRGVLVNYACHPTTLAFDNRTISPDFIGAMRETVEKETGGLALFLLGASGDLAPRYQYVGEPAVADQHGAQLGHSVLATLADMHPPQTQLTFTGVVESGAPLAIWKHEPRKAPDTIVAKIGRVPLPLKDWPTAATLEEEISTCQDRVIKERLFRKLMIRRTLGDGRTYKMPVWLWKAGDAVWVGAMTESYSVLQQQLRQRFPDLTVVCLNLINGSIGYLPSEEDYDQDIYQVWQTPFDRGALEKLIEAMAAEINRLSEPG